MSRTRFLPLLSLLAAALLLVLQLAPHQTSHGPHTVSASWEAGSWSALLLQAPSRSLQNLDQDDSAERLLSEADAVDEDPSEELERNAAGSGFGFKSRVRPQSDGALLQRTSDHNTTGRFHGGAGRVRGPPRSA